MATPRTAADPRKTSTLLVAFYGSVDLLKRRARTAGAPSRTLATAAIILLLVLQVRPPSLAFASDDRIIFPRASRRLEANEIPGVLYHWLSQESLEALAAGPHGTDVFPFKRATRTSAVVLFPPLAGRKCLFAWTNPVTGMGAASGQRGLTGLRKRGNEAYASFASITRDGHLITSRGPRALRLKVAPRARALLLVTSIKEPRPSQPADLTGYDLIKHVSYATLQDEKPRLQEWIVLDPKAIASITADTATIARSLRAELDRLARPGFTYPEVELHYLHNNPYNDPLVVAPFAARVLRAIEHAGDRNVPPRFLNPGF